jgi:hypothetical protein
VLKRLTLKQPRKIVSQHHLWPPLEVVEAALDGNHVTALGADAMPRVPSREAAVAGASGAEASFQAEHLLLPLKELLRRRAAVLARHFPAAWDSGRLVQIKTKGVVLGVLLDRHLKDQQWAGWLAASETSWAGAFDVLLEPEDDPFEPLFGVIQTWNSLTLERSSSIDAKVVGEVSASRLAAIRTVAQECATGLTSNVPSEPGRIALRLVGGERMVLTGTPLGPGDPRHDYQRAYHGVSARLITNQLTQRVSHVQKDAGAKRR